MEPQELQGARVASWDAAGRGSVQQEELPDHQTGHVIFVLFIWGERFNLFKSLLEVACIWDIGLNLRIAWLLQYKKENKASLENQQLFLLLDGFLRSLLYIFKSLYLLIVSTFIKFIYISVVRIVRTITPQWHPKTQAEQNS